MDVVSKITGNNYSAAEFNQSNNELENALSSTGQIPATGDLFQIAKAMADYTASGDFFTDSGAADAYVLSAISSKQAPTAYVDGLRVRFTPGNTNTGASTINVASLGVKNIFYNGVALTAGLIVSGDAVIAEYGNRDGRFNLIGSKIILGSDAGGDIYYRDAGVLKRLPKGSDGDILKLTSGLPAWTTSDGNYTPTSPSLTNIASVDSLDAYYVRIGDTINVYFKVAITPTAGAGTDTDLTISLPVAVDLTSTGQLYGSGTVEDDIIGISPFYESAVVAADPANDGADINFKAQNTNRHLIVGSFSYRV